MLILLYSDANYVLEGFQAEFSITECERNCTNHGVCENHTCKCENGWTGHDCSFEICPDNCGSSYHRGICINTKCQCFEGYSGQTCGLNKNDLIGNR